MRSNFLKLNWDSASKQKLYNSTLKVSCAGETDVNGNYGRNNLSNAGRAVLNTPELPNLKAPDRVTPPDGRRNRTSSRQTDTLQLHHKSSRKKQQQFDDKDSSYLRTSRQTTLPRIIGDTQTGSTNTSSSIFKDTTASFSNNFTLTEEHKASGCTSIKGLKPGNPNWINQDNFFIAETFDNRDLEIYCVLDGHGENGHHASRHCRERFPSIIKSANFDMTQAFAMMQNDLDACEYNVKCSGATCVLAIVQNGKLSVFNCGDSRAVLGRRNQSGVICPRELSLDHKPDRPDERIRVLNCGGHLGCRHVLVNQHGRGPVSMPVGPCRVWYQHNGETLGLAMSRSLGDTVVHKCGVSAEPEILEHMIDSSDEFFILATDGVWDVVDSNGAIQMVSNFASKSSNWSPTEASDCVTKYARSRWEKMSAMVDDITCIVVKLPK